MVPATDEGGSRVTTRHPGRVSESSGDHRVKLAFLGSGAAFSLDRYNGAVVVDGRLLLDGGAPLLPHLHRVGIDPGNIEVVFLTHFHGDHVLGLPPFVLHRVFIDPRPLTFVGPPGTGAHLEQLWELSWGGEEWKRVMRPKFKVKYVTAKRSGAVAGIKYESIKLDHGAMGSIGYRIHVDGKLLAYSGDTEPTAPLEKLVAGADVAIVEATGPGEVVSHTSWEAARDLRKRHPKTRFFFNHLYSGTVAGAVKDLQVVHV